MFILQATVFVVLILAALATQYMQIEASTIVVKEEEEDK